MKKEKPTKEPRERKPNWKEVWATPEDIEAFLAGRVMLRHNVVTNQTEVYWPSEYSDEMTDDARWRELTDKDENDLWKEMCLEKQVKFEYLQRVIKSSFVPDYHPFRYYLKRLPPWNEDKGDFIMELSLSVNVKGDSDEQILFYEYLKKWLVAMVASWAEDDIVNHVMLVLIGEQGAYKTTWFNSLLPPELRRYFYIKTNASRMSKDDLLTLAEYGLVCCEELDAMAPRELNQLKAAMTMPSINEREAYARHKEHRKHLASFCGTGNNVQFLTDTTGNRRWLPFEVENITPPLEQPFNHEGIYSQAYTLYRQGFQYWFSAEDIRLLARHNQKFESPCTERELVFWFFRKPEEGEHGEFMPVGLAMQIVSGQISAKISKEQMGHAFISLGFERKTYRNVRGYVVVRRSTAEIELLRTGLATDTHTPDAPVF
jgi:predicted P-loop ATPase